MFRDAILELISGDGSTRGEALEGFLKTMSGVVTPFSSEWLQAYGSPATENPTEDAHRDMGWARRAVLDVLGRMWAPGPQGGKPAFAAVCEQLRKRERQAGHPLGDEDWKNYFISVFKREQRKHLDACLGDGGRGELRRRLLAGLRRAGAVSADEEHYGLPKARQFGANPEDVADWLGVRATAGKSQHHEGAMPTTGQLCDLVRDVMEEYPDAAPTFGQWMSIAMRVFHLDLMNTGGNISDFSALDKPDGPKRPEDVDDSINKLIDQADSEAVCQHIASTLSKIDGCDFPDGPLGSTFVEYMIFAERSGAESLRVTQQAYADRIGVTDGTISHRQKLILKALRECMQNDFTEDSVRLAFRFFREKYRARHLEIFDK